MLPISLSLKHALLASTALTALVLTSHPAIAADTDAPEDAAQSPAAEEQAKPDKSPEEIATWTLVGVAAAGLVTGGIFGLTAIDEKNRYEDNPEDDFEDRRKARAIAADVSFAVAGAAAFAALIIWLATDDEETNPAPTEKAVVSAAGTSLIVTF